MPFRRVSAFAACLCATLFVVCGLMRAQSPRNLVDVGPFTYPPTFSTTTKQGWPVYFLVRHEFGEMFVPGTTEVDYSVLSFELAVNVAVWLLIFASTICVIWRIAARRAQFSIASLLAITAAAALHLTWWKRECAYCDFPGHPELTTLFMSLSDAPPLLRLLHMPWPVTGAVLFGTACASLVLVVLSVRVMELAMRRWRWRSDARGVI
jgi:hypothetical protein